MKFRYKGCTYRTELMSDHDKVLLKDVIEAAKAKENLKRLAAKIDKDTDEKKPVNRLPYDKKRLIK